MESKLLLQRSRDRFPPPDRLCILPDSLVSTLRFVSSNGILPHDVDVGTYVQAMRNKVEVVRADVEAEAEHLRAGFGLQTGVILARLDAIENGFTKFLSIQENAPAMLQAYTDERNARASAPAAEKSSFEQNAAYRIQVIEIGAPSRTVTGHDDLPIDKAEVISKELAKAGFRTSTSAWHRDYCLVGLDRDSVDTANKMGVRHAY